MNDNGNQPVSPIKLNNRSDDGNGNITIDECDDYYSGLSKREHFAGLAMQGLLAGRKSNAHYSADYAAELSVNLADALLAELDKANA